MKDLEKIKIQGPDGKEVELKVITVLKNQNEDKSFLLYTFDDTTENIDIYASVIIEKDGKYILDSIQEKEDWELVQKAISELSDIS